MKQEREKYKAQNLLECTAKFLTETSVDTQLRTRECIPEDFELHTRRREDLKSQTNISSKTREDEIILVRTWMYKLF
jgi:hypothetical protein